MLTSSLLNRTAATQSHAMLLAQRTRQRLKFLLVCLAVYAIAVLVLALVAPAPNVSFAVAYGRWLVGIPAALVVWAALELLATWSLERQFWRRMPSWVRVALLVAILAAVAVAIFWVQSLLQANSAA